MSKELGYFCSNPGCKNHTLVKYENKKILVYDEVNKEYLEKERIYLFSFFDHNNRTDSLFVCLDCLKAYPVLMNLYGGLVSAVNTGGDVISFKLKLLSWLKHRTAEQLKEQNKKLSLVESVSEEIVKELNKVNI